MKACVYGLEEAGPLARVCSHAQEVSLLTERATVNHKELLHEKKLLDQAFNELFDLPMEKHGIN